MTHKFIVIRGTLRHFLETVPLIPQLISSAATTPSTHLISSAATTLPSLYLAEFRLYNPFYIKNHWRILMTPEQLLRECETATYQERMRRMVELGRAVSSDASVGKTIMVFMQGNVYQRVLAVQSCYGSRDSGLALRALADPSRSVRALALNLVALICSDTELQVALDSIALDLKDALLHCLYRRRRRAATDMYLEVLAARQDANLKKLLPFGSSPVVIRYLGQVIERFELANWQRLARFHPSIAVEQLHAQAAMGKNTTSTSESTTSIGVSPVPTEFIDQRLILQVNAVLPQITHSSPDLALDFVKTLVPGIPLSRLNLQPLALRRPDEIADLVLQAEEQSQIRFGAAVQRMNTEHLLALFTRYPGTVSTHYFRKLTPQQRLALYTVCERGWRTNEGILSYEIVAKLPTLQRIQEGRRHLALPALITKPVGRIRYAAFLLWDEARATLDITLRSPDADLRGATLRALIIATRYERSHLADVLQLVRNRRNEQDPVRREMLTALAELPYGMWQVEHLEDLAQIIRDALNATDLSEVTARSIENIIIHLLPFHPEWSAKQLAIWYRERGHVSFNQLDGYLSNTDVQRITPALLPVLQAWQARESEWQLIGMAQAFGRRIRVFNELINILESVLTHTLTAHTANAILHIFSQYCHEHLAELIPRLLKDNRSYIVLPAISTYLHRYRQDLITPFLGQQAHKGKFSTGKTRIVLGLDSGFFRWTPMQQETFAQSVLEIANDQKQPTPSLLHAIRQLTAMPAINPTYIIKFASDERQQVRDAALRALGRLDAGQGIPTLIEALNDERSRIAIYALRNSLLAMPQAEALALLRNVSFAQVTVAKEVVRLIGDLASEVAYRELLALDGRDLHRDVRVALLRALWPYVEQAETWEVFARAARAPEASLARGVAHIPADGMSALAQRRLANLIATLLVHPEPEVRMDVLQRCIQHPITDYEHTLFTNLLVAMNSSLPDECALAARAIFAVYTEKDAGLVGEAIRGLMRNRRALQITIENFASILSSNRRRLLPTTRAVLAILAEDRLTLTLRLGMIILGLPWEEVAPELVKLADELHADALIRAQSSIQQAIMRSDADLLSLEMALATSDDERLRRLALSALVAQTRQAEGWSDERIARLQAYREDASPMVAEAAQFTFFA